MAENGNGTTFQRWSLGIVISLIGSLALFFALWQFRQDDAVAGCMGPTDRASVQQMFQRLQAGQDRNHELLLELWKRDRNGK